MTLDGMTRRRWMGGFATGTGAVALAACGAGGATGGSSGAQTAAKGKVVFMSQGADPNDEARYKPLIEQFNAKAGPVTTEHIQGDTGGSAVAAQGKLITLAASGTPPDVFWTHAYISPNLQKLGLLADINPYIKKDKDFKISSLFEAPVKDYEADGKQYGLPREATTMLLVYNKELFQKNGVALPTDNWTWDDFLKAAQQLTKPGASGGPTFGTGGFVEQGSNGSNIAYPKVWQEGGDVVDKARTKFTLHQSPAVEQMQWAADLVSKHHVHPFGAEWPGAAIRDSWNTGRIGMFVNISVWTNFNQSQFEWDVAPLPKGKTKSTRTASAGHSVTSGSKNKDAAWEWMRFLHSKASYEHWGKLGLTIPTHKEVASSSVFLNPTQPPKNAKVALDAFTYARSEPIAGDWGNVGAEVQKAMTEAYAGRATAASALGAISQIADALLAKVPGK